MISYLVQFLLGTEATFLFVLGCRCRNDWACSKVDKATPGGYKFSVVAAKWDVFPTSICQLDLSENGHVAILPSGPA